MSRTRLFSVVAVGTLFVVSLSGQQQPTFKSGAKTVAVYATVTEAGGRLVTDLARDDFEVRDNGKPQPISVFSREVQPISVVVMLDRSGSMQGNLQLVANAAEAFVREMMPTDKAQIGSFAERVDLHGGFTSNKQELVTILRTALQQRGPTPLWNALDKAIVSVSAQEGRRVVLVFTDGSDNPGNFRMNNLSFMDVMQRAQESDVMVYAIGLEGRGYPTTGGGLGGMLAQRPDAGLPAIAGETGGGYFELRHTQDLDATFARVADELHRQYLLGFEPPKLDGKMHKLEVRVKKDGTRVRARKEYRATAPAPAPALK